MSASETAMPNDAKAEWVARVLGVAVALPGAAGATRRWEAGKQAWRDASDAADEQIAGLAALLRGHEDPDMRAIAEFGLNALTAGFKVKLMAAIADFEQSGRVEAARSRLRKAIAELRGHLQADPRIVACDGCPDLPMSLRATLTAGLEALDGATL